MIGDRVIHNSTEDSSFNYCQPLKAGPLPTTLDWRQHGAVTPVKNQGRYCAACWAFSIVAAVESHLIIYTNTTEILSEQFLVDCINVNEGCRSESLLQTYAYIVNFLSGVLRDRDYYQYEDRQSACRWRLPGPQGQSDIPLWAETQPKISNAWPIPVVGYTRIKPDEDAMADALYRYGPLTASLNSASMDLYTRGIDDPTDDQCDPRKPNYTVLIVGYGENVSPDGSQIVKYWIIKNSRGDRWGEEGYYYLVRGRNACGIANDVSLPFVTI
ncbi:hypothetical protein ABMA27_001689 [Loxostege sticticalis]|uniref:Peptidase C1A papain C-terminal domain-containing protein n=1 Tax=Loxostege sticticalis TaxID=481309 RepID=A0ABR3HZD4_LOXSC